MRKFGVLLVLSLFLSFACGYVIGRHANTPQIEAHTDTFVITKVDTIIDTLLIPKYIKIKETIRDTLYVPELSKPAEVEISLGLQAGFGYAIACNKFSPYLGFGAQWNFLTF